MLNFLTNKIIALSSIIYFFSLLKKNKLNSSEYEYKLLKNFIKKNDIVLDIGANIGRYSFKFSSLVGKKGFVYSFEPMSKSFFILSSLVYLSKKKNILPIKIALSNVTRKVKMQLGSSKIKNFIFDTNTESKISKKSKKNIELNYSFKIDDLNINEKIKFIKIDSEGHEYEVLEGAINIIKKNKPIILVENNSNLIKNFLIRLKYKLMILNKVSRNMIFIPPK